MNAVIREKYEAPVASEETIEAHLGYMRTGLDEVRKDVRELRAGNGLLREKIDQVRETLGSKIDQVRTALETKLDQFRDGLETKISGLDAKIDQAREGLEAKIDSLDAKLEAKISGLDTNVDQVREGLEAKIGGLDTKVDQVREGLEAKIDSLDAKLEAKTGALNAKIDQFREALDTKIDKNHAEMNSGFAKVADELSKMRADMAGLRGMQKAMLWVMGGTGGVVALAVGVATLGKMLHWF